MALARRNLVGGGTRWALKDTLAETNDALRSLLHLQSAQTSRLLPGDLLRNPPERPGGFSLLRWNKTRGLPSISQMVNNDAP
jgi:hypothetical protein